MWEYINGFLKGNPKYSLHLLGALKINGNEATGLEPFILKSQNYVALRKEAHAASHGVQSHFSTVEMTFEDSSQLYRILAISKFSGPVVNDESNFYILFVLEKSKEIQSSSDKSINFLQCKEYGYDSIRQQLKIHMVHGETLTKPSYMISVTKDNYL